LGYSYRKNVGKPLAVTLDNIVYTAPNVNQKITGGRSQISGNFTQEEAKDLQTFLVLVNCQLLLKWFSLMW
jgi:SecD/SecF fusion protein